MGDSLARGRSWQSLLPPFSLLSKFIRKCLLLASQSSPHMLHECSADQMQEMSHTQSQIGASESTGDDFTSAFWMGCFYPFLFRGPPSFLRIFWSLDKKHLSLNAHTQFFQLKYKKIKLHHRTVISYIFLFNVDRVEL